MALNANVGTAWISVVSDTAKIAPGIKKAIGDAEKNISGEGIGSKLSAGIGKTLKIGAATAGAAVGGILATSVAKGFGRLNAIDQATAKLDALGNSGESVQSIMDNALASVKGTAFGIGEAAGTAATMVASGIKPGEQLESVLKGVADSAAIAGSDMNEMGLIWGKAAAKGKIDGEIVAQLLERQIPIYDILSQKTGVASEDIADMVSKGKIDFQTFADAMNDYVGGGAVRMGQTVSGAMDNLMASTGRFGAALTGPMFTAAPALLSSFTTVFDDLTTAVGPAAEKIGGVLTPALETLAGLVESKLSPWLADLVGKAGDLAASGLEKALDPANWEYVGEIFGKISATLTELWPSLRSLGESFLIISQNVSVATWTALTSALNALAPLIESVLVPLIQNVAEFSEQNPGAVQAIVVALLGFKAVSVVAGPVKTVTKTISNLTGAVSGVSKAFKGATFGQGLLNLMGGAKSANPILAKLGGVVGKVFGAFWKLMPILSKIGKVFLTAIRFVNPWVAGITAIVGALTWFFTKTETGQKIWGKFTDFLSRTWDKVTDKFSAIGEKFQPVLDWFGNIKTAWGELKDAFTGGDSGYGALSSLIGEGAAEWAVNLFDNIKTGWGELKAAFAGGDDGYGALSGIIGEGAAKFVVNLVAKIGTAWQWLKDTVSAVGDFLASVFEKIKNVAMVTIGVIGAIVLTPLIIAWNTWSAIVKAAWENVIRPVWEGISNGAKTMWENYIKPALEGIALGWQLMVDKISFAWNVVKTLVFMAWQSAVEQLKSHWDVVTTAISLAWQKLKDFFIPIWSLIKTLVFDAWMTVVNTVSAHWNTITSAISLAWQALSTALNAAWLWIKANVFQAFMDTVSNLWNAYVSPILQYIGDKWNWLRDGFVAGWNVIRDSVFTKFREGLDGLRNFASSTVDAIRDVWQKLKGYLAEPINFMINTVYNNGIRRAWNIMAGDGTNDGFLPGLKSAPAVAPIQGYRAGGAIQNNPTGRISGPGTGTSDSILARIANGEHMWTAAEVKALGSHERMYRLRNLILNNIPFTTDGNGHFQPLPRGIDNSLGDLAGAAPDLLPKFANGGEIKPAWESQLEAAHRFAKAQHGKQYQWAGPTGPGSSFDCSGFMGSIAATIQGTNPWQRYWATMSFPSPGAQGFVPGLGQGFSIGVWNGGPYGGHTSGTLSRAGNFPTTNVESGGSPSMVKYGIGAAGADSPQHKMHFHLPIGADGSFESGGAGGGFFDFLGGIKSWITEKFGKILDPIKDKLPSPPPEWLRIPGAAYTSGKDALTKTITEKVENLGDLTSAVWAKLTDFDFDLFDTGGVWKPGRVGLNLSGKNEYVFTNKSMQSFQQATESLQIVAREFSEAFAGGDYGYGELASYVGEDIAHALVNEAAWLGGARDEIVAAFDGVDGGLASVARYLGGNEKLAREVLYEVENLGTVGKEFSAAFRGEDFGSGATGSYIGQANAERLLDEVSWIGATVDEVKAAWKGQDSGYAGVMRYLGGNAQMAVTALSAVESAGTVATEISEAFSGGDWGTGEMERYVGPMVAQAVFDTARAAGSFMRREHDDYIHAKYGDFGNLARSLEVIAAGGPKAWGEAAYDVINTAMTRNFNGSAWLQEDSPLVVAALHIGNTLGQWQAQWNQSEVNAELRKSAEDYALGEARSALNLFGLGETVDIAIGLGEKAQDVLNSDDVRNGVAEVKRLVLDPSQHYLGEEIEKKVTELGVEVEHLKSELGSSTIGGYIGMA